jgi:type I restriction enzyme S subunit
VVCIGSTIGKVGITASPSCSNQQINAVIPREGIDSNFLFYALKLHIGQLRRLAGLQAVPIVNKSSFESIYLPAPHKNEQIAISKRILALSNRINNESLLIEKLIQQKDGLMDDLLTGRVRVKQLLTESQDHPGGA